MKFLRLLSLVTIALSLFLCDTAMAQTTATIGMGSSSSSTRGPFQRADTNSSTVFSRFVQVYTAAELASAGIPGGASISELRWELASSNIIVGTGDATLKVYIKNSSATAAVADSWANLIAGSTLAVDNSYNTTNNFPGANGWMPFTFSSPFTYTGGALEIAVDWDCSQVSTPAFDGNGAIKFRWESTAPDDLVVKKTSSSAPSTNITDLKDERANIQIVYTASTCSPPTGLSATNVTMSSADLSWAAVGNATSYNWKVVLAGAGAGGTAVDTGNTAGTMVTANNLAALTSYDLYVQTDCGTDGTSVFGGPYTFLSAGNAPTVATIGMGSSSSSSRGPFQRSDTSSSTVFSRFVHVYTASELAAAGIADGSTVTELNWELASSNVMIGNGDATLKVYIRNSNATAAVADDWSNLISGSTLVVDNAYNTSNNFPGANGWMPFSFFTPFTYTGGAIEVAVDWDCSQVSTPAFSGDGSLKWRWESTAPDLLVVKKTSSSAPSTNISDEKDERANIQFVYIAPICDDPTNLMTSNITTNSADFSWSDTSATSYNWKVVLAGAGSAAAAVDSGMTSNKSDSAMGLMPVTSYDLYVAADCGAIGMSDYAGPITFTTLCADTPATAIMTMVTGVSCNGGSDGAVDMTVTAGAGPFVFAWSNNDSTEDISGLMAGTYSVTIIDNDGCPYYDSVAVDEPMILAIAPTVVPDTGNAGLGSVSLDVTGGTPPYSYTWNGTAGPADSTGLMAGTYMIMVTDANDCSDSVSAVVDDLVSIDVNDYINNLSINPNPTNGIASLDLELSQSAKVEIYLYSVRGKLIQKSAQAQAMQIKQQIDLSAYPNGVYFVRLMIDNQPITKKILLHK